MIQTLSQECLPPSLFEGPTAAWGEMAREVDPKMEYELAVFGLEAKTEIELWWEKMRGAMQTYQKAKIAEVVNSNLGGE